MNFQELLAQATGEQNQSAKPKRQTPLADVEDMILQDQYAFPTGKMINVIGPDGESYSAPSEQVKDAINNGYRLEAPNEIAKREFRKEYKGLKGDVIVGLGQFADEFLGGIPELAFDKLAKRDDFDAKETLKADHELANTIGGIAGFGASMFGGPLKSLFAVTEKAGAETGKAVAKSLAARGISKESANLGAQIIAKTAEKSADLGIQGLVSSAPIALTETALGDPESGAETLLMGGGIGVGLGILAGPTSVLFSKANKAAKESMEKRLGEFEKQSVDPLATNSDDLVENLRSNGVEEDIITKVSKELGQLKKNAADIDAATLELTGKNATIGQLSGSKVIQDLHSTLSKKGSWTGFKIAQQYQEIFDKTGDAIKRVFNVTDDALSRFSVGEEAKTSILNSARSAIDTEGAIFKALRMEYDQVLLDEKPMKMVLGNIKKYAKEEIDDAARAAAKNIAGAIEAGRIKNLNDLFTLRTQVREMFNPLAGNEAKNRVVLDIIEKLNNQEEQTINRAIKERINLAKGSPGKKALEESMRLQGLYDDMQAAKGRWAELARNLDDAGGALGLGKIRSPRDFVQKVDKLKGETLVRKLLPKDDVAALRKLREKFPNEFDAVTKLEKAKLIEGITFDEKINPVKFRTEYAKMLKERPEYVEALFNPEQKRILDLARKVMESIPENVNPSGTYKTKSYMDFISEKLNLANAGPMIGENVTDFFTEKIMKKVVNVDDLIATQKSIGEVSKKLDKVPSIIKGLTTAGKVIQKMSPVSSIYAAQSLLGDTSAERRESFEKLKKKIEEVITSPEILNDNIVKQSEGYSASAPKITDKYIQKTSTAINYLYQNLPKPMTQPSPFFKREWKPSDMDLAKFERKLSATLDPFVIIDALQDGSLTKDHMEAALINYPKFTQALRGRVLEEMTKSPANLPYQARLKVSLLMGYNIDGTTNAKTVADFQNSFAMMPEVSQNGEELSQTGLNKLKPAEPEWTQAQHGLLK